MAEVPEMDGQFARWYADAFMDEGTTRGLRWNGVVEVSRLTDAKTLEVLCRLAFPSRNPVKGSKAWPLGDAYDHVAATLSVGDEGFIPERNTREMQILAAAALDRMAATSASSANAVLTTSCGGARAPELPMDLAGRAHRAILAHSHRKHARPEAGSLHSDPAPVVYKVTEDSSQLAEPSRWASELVLLHKAVTGAIGEVVDRQNKVVDALERRVALDEEELQILWWLVGGQSRNLRKPFLEIPLDERTLSLAYELATMTEVSPGPASIGAILLQTGVGAAKVTIESAVNAVDPSWAREVSSAVNVSPVTTPIHFALEKRGELNSDETWQPGWAGLTDIAADRAMPACELAELFYREHLLLHVSG